MDDSSLVQSGMLYAMEPDLQKRFEKMSAYEIITDLKAVFAPQARAERYEASELFFSAKMEEHSSVSEHVVKMSGYASTTYIEHLEKPFPQHSELLLLDQSQ